MSPHHIEEIARLLGIPEPFILQLCEGGVVHHEGDLIPERIVERVRVSWTLHQELGVNLAGVEVALHLLQIIERDRLQMVEHLSKE